MLLPCLFDIDRSFFHSLTYKSKQITKGAWANSKVKCGTLGSDALNWGLDLGRIAAFVWLAYFRECIMAKGAYTIVLCAMIITSPVDTYKWKTFDMIVSFLLLVDIAKMLSCTYMSLVIFCQHYFRVWGSKWCGCLFIHVFVTAIFKCSPHEDTTPLPNF